MQDALAGHDEGGGAQADFVFFGHLPDPCEGPLHDAHEALVDLFLAPEEAGKVLHPLEIAHGHATGVGDHVGQHQHAALVEDVIGQRCGRAIGTLDDHAGLNAAGVGFGDLLLQRRGDQDVARRVPERVARESLGLGEPGHGALARHMGQQGRHVQTAFPVDGAAVVLHDHNLRAGLGEQLGRHAAHVAEALDGNACLGDVHADALGSLGAHGEDASAGGLATTERSTEVHRLAGDHAGGGGAFVHGIGVHHPRHHLFVGVDVGGGNVLGGADDDPDLAGVAPGHALKFSAGELPRVHTDAALGAAVGHVDGGVLDRHPGRQGHDFGQRDVLVEPHTAFAGAARGIVLHAVALEVGGGTVVQQDRHVHDQGALGAFEGFDPAGQGAQIGGYPIDLLQVDAPGAEVVRIQVGGKGVSEGGRAVGGCAARPLRCL